MKTQKVTKYFDNDPSLPFEVEEPVIEAPEPILTLKETFTQMNASLKLIVEIVTKHNTQLKDIKQELVSLRKQIKS